MQPVAGVPQEGWAPTSQEQSKSCRVWEPEPALPVGGSIHRAPMGRFQAKELRPASQGDFEDPLDSTVTFRGPLS